MLKFRYFILVLFIFSACLGNKKPAYVESTRVLDEDFSQYESYALLPTPEIPENTTIGNSRIIQDMALEEVSQELEMRGYTVDTESPDLLVLVHVIFEHADTWQETAMAGNYGNIIPGINTGPVRNYYQGYQALGNFEDYDVRRVEITEGSVYVDVIDRKKNKLIWRGVSQEYDKDPRVMENSMDRYIKQIFQSCTA